jgi:glycosyltransferase involved in cell wall biosynthesis
VVSGLRVLITVPSLSQEFGGPVRKVFGLARALRDRGHIVRVVGVGESSESGVVELGRRGAFHGTPIPASLGPIRRAVRGADVVHVLGLRDPVGTAAAVESRRRGVPFVVEPVGMFHHRVRSFHLKRGFDSTIGRLVLDGASALIVTSSVERDDLAGAGVDPARVCVRPNGVSFEGLWPLPERGPLRERLGIPGHVMLVVALARLSAIKRLPTLVQAVAASPTLHLLIAGPDEEDGTLGAIHHAASDRDVNGRVHVERAGLWGPDKAAALAEADVFCQASAFESFGTAAAEAAGVGVPVVLTDGCGVKDVLPHAHVVSTQGDIATLANELRAAISDRSRAMSEAGGVRERLSWRSLAADQETIYRSLR